MEEEEKISNEEENIEEDISELIDIKDLNLENERNYWSKYIIKNFIYLPDICPMCKKSNIKIANNKKLLSPLRLVCNNYKCKYRCNLRKFSCLSVFPKIPGSLFFKILYKFIIEEKNASKIKSFLETEEKIKLNYVSLSKILIFIRRCCAHYIKDYYRFNKLGRRSGGSFITVDESDFVDVKGEKLWILGAKNNKTNNLRLDVFKSRTEEDCKRFIYNHIKPNNTIITDGWLSYNFLTRNDSNYVHEVHSGNFGFGVHSTSIIEGAWGTLKGILKRIYGYIPADNFILFLREAEFRFILSKVSHKEKESKIIDMLSYLYDTVEYELYDNEELMDNDNYDY